nr:MAG TPA: hypothetical protein [Caudoviricetes sp.]
MRFRKSIIYLHFAFVNAILIFLLILCCYIL